MLPLLFFLHYMSLSKCNNKEIAILVMPDGAFFSHIKISVILCAILKLTIEIFFHICLIAKTHRIIFFVVLEINSGVKGLGQKIHRKNILC